MFRHFFSQFYPFSFGALACALFSLFFTMNSFADIREDPSLKIYEFERGRYCLPIRNCGRGNAEYNAALDSTTEQLSQLEKLNEKLFFDQAAQEFIDRANCAAKQLEGLISIPKVISESEMASQIQVKRAKEKLIADDLNSKIPIIIEQDKILAALQDEKLKYRSAHPKVPTRDDYPSQEIFAVQAENYAAAMEDFDIRETQAHATILRAVSSTWFGTSDIARQEILDMVRARGNVKLDENSLEKEVILPILNRTNAASLSLLRLSFQGQKISSENPRYFQQQTDFSKPGQPKIVEPDVPKLRRLNVSELSFNLSDPQKLSLYNENGFKDSYFKRTGEDFSTLQCHLEGKFGEGRKQLDRIINIAEATVTFIAPQIPFALAKAGLSGGKIIKDVVLGTVAGTTIVTTLEDLKHACPIADINLSLGECSSQAESVEQINQKIKRSNCLAAVTTQAVALASRPLQKKIIRSFLKLPPAGTAVKSVTKAEDQAVKDISPLTFIPPGKTNINAGNFVSNPQLEVWRLADSDSVKEAKSLASNIEYSLKNSRVASYGNVSNTASEPQFLVMENRLKTIWKPEGGTYTSPGSEVSAYIVDRQLGQNEVAITASRVLNGQKGSMQLIVNGAETVEREKRPRRFTFFDSLISNPDRGRLNYLSVNGRDVAIDHALAFNRKFGNDAPNFSKEVEQAVEQFEKSHIQYQALQKQLEGAKIRMGAASADFTALSSKLRPEIEAARQVIENPSGAKQSIFGTLLPSRSVYENLKNTSEGEWNNLLKPYLKSDQIKTFLQKRKEALETIEAAEKRYGPDIFRQEKTPPEISSNGNSK